MLVEWKKRSSKNACAYLHSTPAASTTASKVAIAVRLIAAAIHVAMTRAWAIHSPRIQRTYWNKQSKHNKRITLPVLPVNLLTLIAIRLVANSLIAESVADIRIDCCYTHRRRVTVCSGAWRARNAGCVSTQLSILWTRQTPKKNSSFLISKFLRNE